MTDWPSPFMTQDRETFRRDFGRFVADQITPNVEAWEAQKAVP